MLTLDRGIRWALWGGILLTANANRKHTDLKTAWVPHLIGNTLALLWPEIYRGVGSILNLDASAQKDSNVAPAMLDGVMHDLVLDNPRYVEYVAAPALAFILTYPKINIYKSDWANRQLFGFGLDSIPHAATAFGLTQLVFDALRALKRHTSPSAPLAAPVDWAADHAAWISAGALAAATAFYESGEYAIHRSELKAVHNDPAQVEMEWSFADTLQDIFSNAVGWLLDVLRNYKT